MRVIIYLVTLNFIFSIAQAETKKFERPAAKKAETTTTSPEKKIDITDLENKYWTEKDKEFSVVQNRLYTKAKRFSLSPVFGTVLNDPFTNTLHFGLSGHYYFSEREGVGLDIWKTSSTDADFIGRLASNNAFPDHNFTYGYIGAKYHWIPIYAKMSLLEKKIIYFDMGLAPGLGVTWLRSVGYATPPTYTAPAARDQYALTFSLDLFQQFFISENFAVRLDVKNNLYQEQVYGASSGNLQLTKMTYSCSVLFGFTYFFNRSLEEEVKTK